MDTTRVATTSEHIAVDRVDVQVFRIPTEQAESDGTLSWDATTLVLVTVHGGGHQGIGYTYSTAGTARVVADMLSPIVKGRNALDIPGTWLAMVEALRNVGRSGIGASAVSAVDCALWDLKARIMDVSLSQLLGQKRSNIPLYGSGGFTSYSIDTLTEQLRGWIDAGFGAVKMKVGRHPKDDLQRVEAARTAIGTEAGLFVDANGAYGRKEALAFASTFHALDVTWFEEPVSSDDIAGLRLLSDNAPPSMDITTGEYIYDLFTARRFIEDARVDVLQADITRCGGVSEFIRVDALCQSHCLPFSSHTAPALHLPVCAALKQVRHMEYFHDHVRIEDMLFEGVCKPSKGMLAPDVSRPGFGLELKQANAKQYLVS